MCPESLFSPSPTEKRPVKKKISKAPVSEKKMKKPKHEKVEKNKNIAVGKIIFLSGKKVTLCARGHFFHHLRQKKTVKKKFSKPR
jgi:hypothetical protein